MVGYEIHEEGQKTEHILLALYKGISAYSSPKNITIDNGKTYRSKAFAGGRPNMRLSPEEILQIEQRISACGRLSIEKHFTKPYNHHGKDIEREFSRLHRGFCRWFDTYFGVTVDRHPDKFNTIQKSKDKEEKLPTIEEFKSLFDKYLTEIHDTYVYKSGENKGKNPVTLWNEGYAQYAAENPGISPEALALLCARQTEPKTIRGNGIFDAKTNSWYYGAWMSAQNGVKAYLRIPPIQSSLSKMERAEGEETEDEYIYFCYDENDDYLGSCYRIERIAKILTMQEKEAQLSNAMERVNTVNKQISKPSKKLIKNIGTSATVTAFDLIAKTNAKIAEKFGLDTQIKTIENDTVILTQEDRDIAENNRRKLEGMILPAIAVGQDWTQEPKRELKRF
jgi:hypothetical protein